MDDTLNQSQPTAPVTEPTTTVPGQVPPPPMGQVEPQAPVEPTAPVTEPTATVPGQVPPQVEPVEPANPNPVNPNPGGVTGGGIGA